MNAELTIVPMNEIERKHKGYWFTAGAMRFFKSRVGDHGYLDIDGCYYFVSSEKGPDTSRKYSIRYQDTQGHISTIGEFQAYTTGRQAKSAMLAILNK